MSELININEKEWRDLTGEDISSFLALPETEESFFFEFKDDRVDSKKIAEEISAFANTYGGYIFLGVSDKKSILGCSAWNEQRILTTIHDSITPTPLFDVKKLICNAKTVYIIRIDEGSEPPYITNQGKILERISSASCVVKDSARLTQLYNKREDQLRKVEKAISIPPLSVGLNNVYGYIDIGFHLTFTDRQAAIKIFNDTDIKDVAKDEIQKSPSFNLMYVGNSMIYSPGGLSSTNKKVPAHLNNFLEIMCDGSARMRVLLHNNNPKDTTVNMITPFHFVNSFRVFYERIFGALYPDSFVFAKKYEALTVLQQFQPYFLYEQNMVQDNPLVLKQNEILKQHLRDSRAVLGVDTIITDDRIPKSGLYTVDKQHMQKVGIKEYTSESILLELFHSQFVGIRLPYEAASEIVTSHKIEES